MSEQEINALMEQYEIIYIKSNKAYSYTVSDTLNASVYNFTINETQYQFELQQTLENGVELIFESYISSLYVVGNGKKYEIPLAEGSEGTTLSFEQGAFVGLDDPVPCTPYGVGKYEQDLDSGRDMDGIMVRNVLDHHPHKIFLNMPYGMNIKQMKRFLNLVDQSTLYIKTFNPWLGELQITQMEMMHGDLVPEVDYWYFDYDKQQVDCKYNAISVEIVEY